MRYLALFVAFFAVSCHSGDLDSRRVPTVGTPPSPPSPPSPVVPAECLNLCQDACDDYGDWSEWSPATNTECEGKQFTQSHSKTRTCPRAHELCEGVTCATEKTQEQEVVGTDTTKKECRPCHASCETGCEAKVYSDPSPAVGERCEGVEFTQTKSWTQECFHTCDDKENCLCSDTNCPRRGSDSIDAIGELTTPCESPYCTDWVAVAGDEGKWQPETSTRPEGEPFKQTRKEERTCKDLCPNTSCELIRTAERQAVGSGESGDVSVTVNNPNPNTNPNPPPPPAEPVVEPPTCADCKWGDWAEQMTGESCPASPNSSMQQQTITVKTRTRTIDCTNLNPMPECFIVNIETHTIPCPYCEGEGQEIVAGRCQCVKEDGYKQASGECVCDASLKYYRSGDACQKCDESTHVLKQVEDGSWVCLEKDCVQACTVSDFGECTPTGALPDASKICIGVNENVPSKKTASITCPDAEIFKDCPTELVMACSPTAITVEGKQQRASCDEYCTDWSTPRAWKSCPSNTALLKNPSFTDTITNTRTCPDPSKAELCQPATNCNLTMPKEKVITCECTGMGQIKSDGKCVCNRDGGYIQNGNKCVCNTSENYYESGDTCKKCPSDQELVSGECQCTGTGQIKNDDGKCVCPEGQHLDGNVCTGSREAVPEDSTVDDTEDEDPLPVEDPTCADCNDWGEWSGWSAEEECPADDMFTAPSASTEKSRIRSRECAPELSELACFTTNTETETCAWCQGEGQKLVDGECICDKNKKFYKDDKGNDDPADDECVSCGGRQVNSNGDGCVCKVTGEKKHYYSKYSDLDIGKASAPSWLRKGKIDLLTRSFDPHPEEAGNCLCDGKRNYIAERGRYGENDEGIPTGNCVCRNQHKEVTEDGITKCQPCGEQEDLRKVSENKWDCVTCDLRELRRNPWLHAPGKIGPRHVGKECYCATHSGDGSIRGATRNGISDVVIDVLNNGNTDLDTFDSWWYGLNTWYYGEGSDTAQKIRNRINNPPHSNPRLNNPPPQPDNTYKGARLWQWYLRAHRAAQYYDAKRSLYPPLPQVWKDFHREVTSRTLHKDNDLRYVTCTVFTWLTDD